MSQKDPLQTTITFLENRREILGDDVVDAALTPLRRELKSRLVDLADRRKQVTVLFADLSNFTAMSEFMDAEDVRHIVELLWARIDKVIIDHGGAIDKHIGDAVMALWGIDQTREDDPERAVHAALAMRDAVDTWRADMRHIEPTVAEQEPPISIRIGVNTGAVILGLVGTTGEFTAIGDTVNTASRLESAAPLGNILISQSTFLHVRGLFELREREPISIKGKSKPLSTYLVQSAVPRQFKTAQRGIEGVAIPMVGRSRSFAFLQERFFEVLLENHPQFITITGDAGIGKSRLIYEFNSWMDSQSWRTSYFMGRARQATAQKPYWLLHTLIASRFDIQESNSPQEIQNKLELGFFNEWEPTTDLQRKIHYIAHLAKFPLANSRYIDDCTSEDVDWKARASQDMVEYFLAISLNEPTVFFIEDLQWADQETLEILMTAVESAKEQMLMIVATARRSLRTDMDSWLQNKPTYSQYALRSLSTEKSHELIEAILHKIEWIPHELLELISSRSGGNPYYIEEFIKMLVRDQIIVKGDNRWTVHAERLAETQIPTTLTSILEAQLEKIPPASLRLVQYASIVGETFWLETLVYMTEKITWKADNEHDLAVSAEQQVDNGIAYLVQNGLIRENHCSQFRGTKEYSFTNAFLKQACYERILKRERQIYEGVAKEWLQKHAIVRKDPQDSPEAGQFNTTVAAALSAETCHRSNPYRHVEAEATQPDRDNVDVTEGFKTE